MAQSFVSSKVRPLIETMEGRTLFSTTPVFGQYPPIIISKAYPDKPEDSAGLTPPPVTAPVPGSPVLPPSTPAEPVVPPVQSVLAEAPEGLKARGYRKARLICLKWTAVDSSADTVVVESATDGQNFTTLAMLDADHTKYGARHLDRDKTYTFRVYTLDANGNASEGAEVVASLQCKK